MRRSTVYLLLFAVFLGTDLATAPLDAATAGTYTGDVGGRTFSLTVNDSNQITGWSSGGNYDCPGYTVTSFSVAGMTCAISGADTFVCGGLGCGSNVNSRINGSFSGNTVTGILDADFDPPTLSCCSTRDQPFTASVGGGGGLPAAPSDLAATAISTDQIDLAWQDNSDDETEFRVEMRQGTFGTFIEIGTVGANQQSMTAGGLVPDTLYQFRVRASNANGGSPYSNTASATTFGTGGSLPAPPSNLTATAVSDDRIDLAWLDNSDDEILFHIERRQGTVGPFTDIGGVGPDSVGTVVTGLDPDTLYQFRVRARNDHGSSPYSNVASAMTPGVGDTPACIPDATTLCLNNNRFRVRATFETGAGDSGQAQVVELTPDTGYLWFFTASNVEAVVKVLNACAFNNRFWVFAGGLTDVEVVLTVADSQTGTVKTYTNPQGEPFQPIQDTSAFATCP